MFHLRFGRPGLAKMGLPTQGTGETQSTLIWMGHRGTWTVTGTRDGLVYDGDVPVKVCGGQLSNMLLSISPTSMMFEDREPWTMSARLPVTSMFCPSVKWFLYISPNPPIPPYHPTNRKNAALGLRWLAHSDIV